jgi:hypothetical protein
LDFVAAADKPQIAAFFTVSEEMDDEGPGTQEDWLYFYNNLLHNKIETKGGGTKHLP